MADVALVPTETQILAAVTSVAESAERSPHTDAFARRLRGQLELLDRSGVQVVVAGETKRGKSALVNALLGEADLVPVDTGVCTATHVVVQYADSTGATAVDTEGVAHDIDRGDLASWVTRDGVRAVHVRTPAPLLSSGLELVDTPGVGGLVAAHAAVTLAALAHADALLLVLDVATPITTPELAFLRQAAERIDTLVVALTHADLYPPDVVDRIVASTRSAIATAVPRLAGVPLLPVSSVLHSQLGHDDPEDESGIRALSDRLRADVVDRGRGVRLANLVRSALGVVRAVQWLGTFALGETPDADKRAQLAAEEERLGRLAEGSATWTVRLGDRMQQLRFDAEEMLARRQTGIRRRYDERLSAFDARVRESLPDELAVEVQALAMDLGTFLDTSAAAVAEAIAAEHDIDRPEIPSTGGLTVDATPAELERVRPDLQQLFFLQMPMFTLGRPLALLAHLLPIGASAALGPIGVVGGTAFGLAILRSRLRAAGQQRGKELVRATLADATGELRLQAQRRIHQLQVTLRDAMSAAYARELAAVKTARAELQRVVEADAAQREIIKAAIRNELAGVAALQQTLEGALVALTGNSEEVRRAG